MAGKSDVKIPPGLRTPAIVSTLKSARASGSSDRHGRWSSAFDGCLVLRRGGAERRMAEVRPPAVPEGAAG
ncbi:hypothetical protein [Streptomyces longispororuber]|uniref:hypothetical protein n=1 Tax=Streptomyces longispororuber TaxID=68230 RepID=UPI00210B98F2|nr:hypothetical protein [Streptomyces longispororuber]MCQ4211149.1 hypothetical protein [Streptomyces longispororuber]